MPDVFIVARQMPCSSNSSIAFLIASASCNYEPSFERDNPFRCREYCFCPNYAEQLTSISKSSLLLLTASSKVVCDIRQAFCSLKRCLSYREIDRTWLMTLQLPILLYSIWPIVLCEGMFANDNDIFAH